MDLPRRSAAASALGLSTDAAGTPEGVTSAGRASMIATTWSWAAVAGAGFAVAAVGAVRYAAHNR